jgi:photosystem II stability/assembly factor-like uncharacterized protein
MVLYAPVSYNQFQWQLLPASPVGPGRHDDAFFVSPLLGWVVNGAGEAHRTMDGGAHWTLQADRNLYFRAVGFADSANGWIGVLTAPPAMLSTTDGGVTWQDVTNIPSPLPPGICGISVVNRNVVYASGKYSGPARVVKTTDGGASWSVLALDSIASFLVDCYFTTPDSGFVVGARGTSLQTCFTKILFTSDGGATWKTVFTGTRQGELCWKITFPTPARGYVSIERFLQGGTYILKTTNGGETWHEKQFSASLIDQQGIGFATESHGWVGGWNNPTYETTNGGDTWTLSSFGTNVNRFRFLNDTLGYAVGSRVYKYSRIPVNVDEEETFPVSFALEQNYPNPFNPKTNFEFGVSSLEFVSLKVFDVLGRELTTLVNEITSPGRHTVTWDGSNYPSGVYLYRLTTPTFTSTRRMILLK